VTIDAAALCLKSGNAVLLRGGSEAIHTNRKLADIITMALKDVGLPSGCVEFIDSADREAVMSMLKQDRSLDVIIPRGGQQLISFIREHSSVPVIAHGEGNCHVFVDRTADLRKAGEIVFNAKVQRPSVCNAMETLLVHEAVAAKFLPEMIKQYQTAKVEVRGCAKTCALVPGIKRATEEDWSTEYLELIVSIRVVKDMDEAIDHIERYGSEHTESIVTTNYQKSREFIDRVNSSAVMVNASTRFNDGGELGLGAEIGISTSKIHAFGPMGLEELTTTKFIVFGDGQIRE